MRIEPSVCCAANCRKTKQKCVNWLLWEARCQNKCRKGLETQAGIWKMSISRHIANIVNCFVCIQANRIEVGLDKSNISSNIKLSSIEET